MSTESFRGKAVTIRSTDEKGIIQDISRRKNGQGALAIRYIVKINDSDTIYECMPHEVKFNEEAPMMGMSY